MILFKQAAALRQYLQPKSSIGFVPTMGALHEGHLSLIEISKQKCDITVCSIFVNPTQFNDKKDFEQYPITIDRDILLLEQAGCDVLFYPSVEEIYPPDRQPIHYDLGSLETLLEGKYRPGHFQGVCQVVHRLLDIVSPNELLIGQKDYQQCMVITRLTEIISSSVHIVIGPTLREPSGLAMSSRNMRLSADQKERATAIHKALLTIKQQFNSSSIDQLIKDASQSLTNAGFEKVDYVSIADAHTLEPLSNTNNKAVALIAAFIGGVRLIDNMPLN